ncbi:hypothetical protein THRCLA_02289, partial [Thraustotheca clavata]
WWTYVAIVFFLAFVQGHEHHDHDHDDYYEELGLGMDASDSDIKKAYRRLSLQYHPDKNPGNTEADTKFQKISKAYEVLSNAETRDIYDLEGVEGLERHANQGNRPSSPFGRVFALGYKNTIDSRVDAFFGGGGGKPRGPDATVDIPVTLEELYNGAEKQARFMKNVICRKCRGSGAKDGKMKTCKTCGGQGFVLVQQQMGPGFTVQMQQQCPKCGGKGKTFKHKCPHCNGNKVVAEEKIITGVIERGMPSNHEIVFERESEQRPGMIPGNVIMRLIQQPHKTFRRTGDDLHADITISLKDALLGFESSLIHLDERKVTVEADGVTTPFEVRVLSGEGMPHHNFPSQHGDLHVLHRIQFPKQLSPAQKELVERLLP